MIYKFSIQEENSKEKKGFNLLEVGNLNQPIDEQWLKTNLFLVHNMRLEPGSMDRIARATKFQNEFTNELVFCRIQRIGLNNDPMHILGSMMERAVIKYENSEEVVEVHISNLAVVEMVKPMTDITIGSDIELLFVRNGRQIMMNHAVDSNEDREIGSDHGGEVGELRPQFGNNPLEHFNHIERVLKKLIEGKMLREDTYLDSSHILGNRPCGGHIHFGVKNGRFIEDCRTNLDYWLSATVQPLFPENIFLNRISGGEGYGKLSDVRTNEHGFEYRTLPSFIFDREITKGILCLAYAIVKLTVNKKLKVRLAEEDSRYRDNFIKNYMKYGVTELNDIREENIKKLLNKNLLGDLIKHINPLFQAIKYSREYSGDIAEGWGMEYEYVLNSGRETVGVVADEEAPALSPRQVRDAVQTLQYDVRVNPGRWVSSNGGSFAAGGGGGFSGV